MTTQDGPLPSGTVTFLFTDIEGSTGIWERHPDGMTTALALHNTLLRAAIAGAGGMVFETAGDSFVAVFRNAPDAARAAAEAQRTLVATQWPQPPGSLQVRMALHTGPAERRSDGYHAQHTLSRLSRILACGHGGQVLVSEATGDALDGRLPAGVTLIALGAHRLRDLIAPQHLFQLTAPGPPWGLPVAFPPLRSLDARQYTLPVQLTPLIGRDREVADVVAMLRAPSARIVTLTGPGGSGKTRVGLQAAAQLVDGFEHGACFVDLAPINDADLVASTMAMALGVAEVAGEQLIETLGGTLRHRRLLLLVDNFEQVSEAAPQVGRLASVAPGVCLLVTSRVPLQISGEHEYPIPPPPLPDLHRLPPVGQLGGNEAVRLFVERATAIRPGFRLTGDNAPAVAEICVRLDGLPLAIELAAARTRLLTPQAIAARLHNRFDLLTGGRRDADARQRTLRATIEWSYNLLGEAEQRLFRRLGVFVGGRTLTAIETVCDADGSLGVDVVDGVESLVHSSLLRHEETASGDSRFSMLETIHEFARETLAACGELDELCGGHARFFLDLAESTRDASGDRTEATDLDVLQVEHDNIRRALEWALAGAGEGLADRAELALRLAAAMARFWYVRGHWQEGADWSAQVLARAGREPFGPRAAVLYGAGQLAVESGDYAAGRALFADCEQTYRRAGDHVAAALALGKVGDTAYAQGDYTAARRFLEVALARSRELGNPLNVARLLSNVGELMRAQGEFTSSRQLNDEALALLAEAGRRTSSWAVIPLCNLGHALLREGDVERASTALTEALAMAHGLSSSSDLALALLGFAGIAAARGDADRAARLLGAVDVLQEALGATLWPADRSDYDHHLSITRSLTDAVRFEHARRAGRDLGLDEAMDLTRPLRPTPLTRG